jgi:hypothetical protein
MVEGIRKGDFLLATNCQPQPVDAIGSSHDVNLHNEGPDDYIGVKMVVSICQTSPQCSLRLSHDGATGVLIPNIPVGTLPRGRLLTMSLGVMRSPSRTAKWEKIRTTVEFTSWYEADPQNDEQGEPYLLQTVTNVEVS